MPLVKIWKFSLVLLTWKWNFHIFNRWHSNYHNFQQLWRVFLGELSFYHAALNAGRSSREKGVCLSVRLSVKRVNCDKAEEKSVQIFIPCERQFSPVFKEKEWLVGASPSTSPLGQLAPVGAKSSILNRYSLVAPQL